MQKCSAFSTLREQSRGEGFAEEQPLTSVRLRSARFAQIWFTLACLGLLDEAKCVSVMDNWMSLAVATSL